MKKKIRVVFLFALMTMWLMTGCQFGQSTTKDQASESQIITDELEKTTVQETSETYVGAHRDEMIVAMNAPTTLNPLYNTASNVQQALYLIFSPLINIEQNGTVSSNLAESWMFNETGTALTLTLKSGVKWHDGTSLTVEDVIYTINQIKSIADSPYQVAVENIASVEKVDDLTMKIVYKQVFSGTLQTLFFPVIPKHIYDVPNNDALTIIPIGTGPYKFESMASQKNIILAANPNYFKGAPKINKVKITIIPDEQSSLYAFKQGLIDVVYTNMTDWGKYTNSKNSVAYEMSSNIYEFMGLNLNKSIFQSAAIRSALLYALDRDKMVERYYLDHAIVTDTPISPASYLFDDSQSIEVYDKEKARLLLTEAGYEKDATTGYMTKNGTPFSFSLLVNKENHDRVNIAQEIKENYKDIGINVEVEIVDQETYLTRISSKQYDAFLGGWQLSYATDLSFALHSSSISSGLNYAGYQDAKMDELLNAAFTATGEAVKPAYHALQKYFSEQNPYISLYFKKSVLITSNRITGNISPTVLNIFANVEEWRKE